MRILLIEDNPELAANVGDYLALRGHQMDYAGDGLTGLHLCVTQHYDAVVLDVGLPGLDGVTLCRKLRGEAGLTLPVLMLTARDTLDDKVTGLDAGADDYLVKPFALRELEARLNALARRGDSGGHRRRLQVGELSLDLDTQTARRGARELKLTPTGFKLLELLMRAAPAVVDRARLESALWDDRPPASDTLRLHVHGLRATLDPAPERPMLRTVRGRGWALVAGDDDAA